MKKREKSAVLQFIANMYAVIIASFMPFVVRTTLVHYLGIEYVGVSSLFSSILQVLNIADFGLATALAFYLFKPAEENDVFTINIYMGYFRHLFRIVGMIILIAGLFVLPFLPILVKGKEYPAGLNIYVIYIAYILQTALYYLTNMYISTLLCAYLKSYLSSLVSGTGLLIMYIVQIVIIVFLNNYYLFAFALLITVFAQNILFHWIKKKEFPWLDFSGKPSKDFVVDLHTRIYAMIVSKIRNVSRNAFDCIIVSLIFGLTILAEYQNYYQVMLVPFMLTIIVRQAIQPSLGNGIAVESEESNYGIVKQYMFINNFVSTICATCLLSLFQPFMKLWMGSEYLLGMDIVICISVYYIVLGIAEGNVMLREATGIWKEGMWVSIFEAISNLILNYILAKLFGLCGIICATIITIVVINIPLESFYIFNGYFKNKYRDYIVRIFKYVFETIVILGLSYIICIKIEITNFSMMLVRTVASVFVPMILFLIVHFREEEMKESIVIFIKLIKIIRKKYSEYKNTGKT